MHQFPTKFSYYASGLSFLRLRYLEARTDPLVTEINGLFKQLWRDDHTFNLLFNAHIEQGFGPWFKECYRGKGIYNTMADSGGLQIITQGLTLTPKLKTDVYKTQGAWSDHAMSFDEIPVKLLSDRAVRSDTSNKVVDIANFDAKATLSGKNLKEQLEVFAAMDSTARPMLIAQGYDLDSYCRWTELMLKEIPKELQERMGGVAVGAAALGNGLLEDCKRAFYYTQLPYENKHLHLLGVGSISRLLPAIQMWRNGMYKDVHISYDSTTHTSGVEMGRFYSYNNKTFKYITPGRAFNHEWVTIYNEVKRHVPTLDMDMATFHEGLNTSVNRYKAKHNDVARPPLIAYIAVFVAGVTNFLRHFADIRENFALSHRLVNVKEIAALESFGAVKDRQSYEQWERLVKGSAPSMQIKQSASHSLEDLFA